jgi:SAM-dependent methyltransferase
MCAMTHDSQPIADFFDRECCAAVDSGASPVPGSGGVTAVLLDALTELGIRDMRVIELGSGAGALSRALVGRGAAHVTGFDLSPASVEHATAAAGAAGLADRLDYRVGDAALAQLETRDVVVSQKVFCCYPGPDQLLANTLPAAGQVYALVLPESRGPVGLATRLIVGLESLLLRLRRDPFRAYVHDVRRVDAAIQSAGFERRVERRHWGWLVLAYSRG